MPEDIAKEILSINIEKELKHSYLDYAMSVIVGRALPDVRDGLKPVHRRSLFAMHELRNDWNKPYKKSARIVGDVIGKYHPHGETAVYDTIVRMAQPFSLRYMLVDGQGNFGSVDGDSPAAMRYTEVRLSRFAHCLLADLDKETVDFAPNYDDTELLPCVLPTHVPNLLVNGSSGIAVGMATNIPPHNVGEVIDACIALINNPELSINELMQWIPGPDFPTAATINGRAGIVAAYQTGRGRIHVRAQTRIETGDKGKTSIVVYELPYQVNKARLLEKIAELVRDKKIEGISGIRDESDKQGMRVVIEIQRGEQAEVVLNNLYIHTSLQTVFGINMVALDKGQPKIFNLKALLSAFIQHRREVVTRRCIYELRKARERAHILEGLAIALANIDSMIALIKAAKSPADAKQALLETTWTHQTITALLPHDASYRPVDLDSQYGWQEDAYRLSPAQAQAILALRLHRLTGLEQESINEEYGQQIAQIKALLRVLSNPDVLHEVICEELSAVKAEFGDERRTAIIDDQLAFTDEELIESEERVITLSRAGYTKAQSLDVYRAQHRGGRGRAATSVKSEDIVHNLIVANTHDTLLCFSTTGKVYSLKVYQIPQGGPSAKGRPLINLLPLTKDEKITAILPIKVFDDSRFVFMATKQGKVKKTPLTQFSHLRSNGKIALALADNDQLIGADVTDGSSDILLVSTAGQAIRFSETAVRPMGTTASGVRGMRIADDHQLIALIIVNEHHTVLTVTESGYGQRTKLSDYRTAGRGGQGVRIIQVAGRNGKVVGAVQVTDDSEALMITNLGTMVRIPMSEVSVLSRGTQGVRLIQLSQNEQVAEIEAISASDAAPDRE